MMRLFACLFVVLISILGSRVTSAASPDLAQAEQALREGRSADAWRLLQPLEFERAGDVDFDYLYGVAALEAGFPDRATLAFERVLAVSPDYAGARLDMARAYYALGDLQRAKAEFETVQRQDPPPAARATVERCLAAIEARGRSVQTRITGYAEASVGRDTNVNNSTSGAQVYLPVFGVSATLSATSLRTPDNYLTAGAGAEVVHALGDRFALFAGIDGRFRLNQRADTYDFQTLDLRAGAMATLDRHVLRAGLARQQYVLDNARYRETTGVFGDWRLGVDARNQFAVYGQYNRFRYVPSTLVANDVNQTLAGAGWLHGYDDAARTHVYATVFAGRENDTNGRADGAKGMVGLRLAGQVAFGGDSEVFASAGAQVGDFEAQNVVFQTFRKDRVYDATLGVNWRFVKDWTLRPQVTYVRNQSNLPIYDYDRYDVSLTVRRDFR